jgi:hypothetical protein
MLTCKQIPILCSADFKCPYCMLTLAFKTLSEKVTVEVFWFCTLYKGFANNFLRNFQAQPETKKRGPAAHIQAVDLILHL